MAFGTDDLLNTVSRLRSVEQLKTTVSYSLKSGAFVGATTFLCGVIGGPVGLAVGGVASSCVAAHCTKGKFETAPNIILHQTTPQEREKLAKALRTYLKSKNIFTVQNMISAVQNNEDIAAAILQIVIMFLSSDLGKTLLT